jgi:hypothetical protein
MTFRGEGREAQIGVVALGGVRRNTTDSECWKRKQRSRCKEYLEVEVGQSRRMLVPGPVSRVLAGV